MKRITIIIIVLAIISTLSVAQNKQGERVEAEKIAFFTKRLDLSPDEAKLFWPVYNDYTNRKGKISMEKNALMRYINQNSGNLSEKELVESGDKVVDFMFQEAELAKTFHEEFKKILPAGKVVKIYQIDAQFKRILLDQLQKRRSQQNVAPKRQL